LQRGGVFWRVSLGLQYFQVNNTQEGIYLNFDIPESQVLWRCPLHFGGNG